MLRKDEFDAQTEANGVKYVQEDSYAFFFKMHFGYLFVLQVISVNSKTAFCIFTGS